MAQISCPNCDAVHELDDALLSAKPRRMRCASCREVFEAIAPETNHRAGELSSLVPAGPTSADHFAAPGEPDAEIPAADPADEGQIDFDAIDIGADAPSMPETGVAAADPFDTIIVPADEATKSDLDPAERAFEAAAARREKQAQERAGQPDLAGQHETTPHPPPRKGFGKPSAAVVLMAGSVWTLMTIGIFRNEVARVVPETIPVFSALGMDTNLSALDILEVKSSVGLVENQETLEITGRITNLSKVSQKVPQLRLALRNAGGIDVYIWTSAADKSELAGGESFVFSRKLASPPAEAQSVMVRFVAKDDITSSIR